MTSEEISGTVAATPDIEAFSNDSGRIEVNDEVVAFIATIEMVKVDGVITLSGRSSYSDYEGARSKDVEKGVVVKTKENHCTVAVEINIRYGVNVYDTALKLQRAIKDAIENYTGLIVDKVDVTIRGMVNESILPPVRGKNG